MSRKITLCLHALYLMYPLTSYGSETPHGAEKANGQNDHQTIGMSSDRINRLMDRASVESKVLSSRTRSMKSQSRKSFTDHVDTVPNYRPYKASANAGGTSLIKSDGQPQHKNTIPSSQVEKISSKSGQAMRPIMQYQDNGIMTPKTISAQNSPKGISHQSAQNSFKLVRRSEYENIDKKSLDQAEGSWYTQDKHEKSPTENLRNSRHFHHSDDHLKELQRLQSKILNDKNKPLQRADRSKVVQAINANLECTDCLKCPTQDIILRGIGSYNHDVLPNAGYVRTMINPYMEMMKDGWALLKADDKDVKKKAAEYLQEVSEYLHKYNTNGIRGDCDFKAMIDDAIIIKNILCKPEPQPKGVVGAIDDALQPDPEMTRRIAYWTTKASNKIIEFGEQNLKANNELDQLYYASLKGLSALKKKSTEMNYNAPKFVSLKTETNDIFNQLEIKAQELGIDYALLAKARQKIMNIGGDKKDQDLFLYKKSTRSAPHDVNDFRASKAYYRNHLQDDANEMTIKVPQGRKVDIY